MKKLIISLSSLLVVASPIAMTIACSKDTPAKPTEENELPDDQNPGSVDPNIALVETERARLDAIDSIVLLSGDYTNNQTFETAVRNHSSLSLNSSFTYVIAKVHNNFTIQITKGTVSSALVTIGYTVESVVEENKDTNVYPIPEVDNRPTDPIPGNNQDWAKENMKKWWNKRWKVEETLIEGPFDTEQNLFQWKVLLHKNGNDPVEPPHETLKRILGWTGLNANNFPNLHGIGIGYIKVGTADRVQTENVPSGYKWYQIVMGMHYSNWVSATDSALSTNFVLEIVAKL